MRTVAVWVASTLPAASVEKYSTVWMPSESMTIGSPTYPSVGPPSMM
jgi:hypothetical protein